MINIEKGFLQGDSYAVVGFCLTEVPVSMLIKEVPVSMLIEETDGYTKGQGNEERVRGTHCIFIDDLKIYEERHQKLEV